MFEVDEQVKKHNGFEKFLVTQGEKLFTQKSSMFNN